MDRLIFHCDCNNFYASCEILERPELRDVPMAVAGDPERRTGIVVAKNEIADATILNDSDSVLITSVTSSICISGQEIPSLSRVAAGNILIKNGNVISMSRI